MSGSLRAIGLVAVAACATAPAPRPGAPRGLHASEHLRAAHAHDAQASRRAWPGAVTTSSPASPNAADIVWFRSWDAAVEHERAARVHRSKAAELQATYDAACGARPLADVSVSPLQRYAIGGWNTAMGVILYLTPDAGSDRLLADLHCHRAWMMLAPADMDDCPLDLPGLALDVRGDAEGITVSIVVRDATLVGELQRRAAVELESAARQRATSAAR